MRYQVRVLSPEVGPFKLCEGLIESIYNPHYQGVLLYKDFPEGKYMGAFDRGSLKEVHEGLDIINSSSLPFGFKTSLIGRRLFKDWDGGKTSLLIYGLKEKV